MKTTLLFLILFLCATGSSLAQSDSGSEITAEKEISDRSIEKRIRRILQASEKFNSVDVVSTEGIVKLSGSAKSEEDKDLAGKIARKVEGVVFAYNNIETERPSNLLDWSLLEDSFIEIKNKFWSRLPRFVLAVLLLIVGYLFVKLISKVVRPVYERKYENSFLANLMTKLVLAPAIVIFLYLALQVTGLTRLAVTVLTGTGLIGLALGIAFKNIAENFFASVLLSIQRPYEIGDLIKIGEHLGYVRQLTSRGTTLMTLDGNHVQIPNSLAYSETLTNYSANKNMRLTFKVGIGYEDIVSEAQSIALKVANNHASVLKSPEPLVLVESLGASTVNLGVYFWLDSSKFSQFKVKSSMIRLVKKAFEKAGISMPDEAREIVFPKGVPVVHHSDGAKASERESRDKRKDDKTEEPTVSESEGHLGSEFFEITDQAENSRELESGENLLRK